MAEKHNTDDFDDILKSIDSAAEGNPADVNLDELLAQFNVDFPPDFESDTSTQKARSGLGESIPIDAPPEPEEPPKRARRGESPEKQAVPKSPKPRRKPEKTEGAPSRSHRALNIVLIFLAVILAAGIVAVILTENNADPYGGKILPNVTVAGVDVGSMTRQEAADAISAAGNSYGSSDMTVVMGRDKIILAAAQTNASLNISEAVEAAYAYGRTGSTTQRQQDYRQTQQDSGVAITAGLHVNTDYIRSTVSSYLDSICGEYVPSGYTLEGTRPALDADGYDPSVPCQNLVLTVGHPGSGYDLEAILCCITDAYGRQSFQVEIPSDYLPQEPEELDIGKIYEEIHIDPVNATEDTPGSCGYTFPLEAARTSLELASYGDVISIPMQYTEPVKLDDNGSFTVLLAFYSTPLSSSEAYNQNMQLLAKQLNGMTLNAHSTFSFTSSFGKLTEENGFRLAPSHGDQCAEEEIGGGADQVATTLYVAAMTSGMRVTERHNAPHVCPYTVMGTELSVSGWMDFKFTNPLDCPIMIRAKVTDSLLVVRILCEEDVDYEVKLETETVATTAPRDVKVQKKASDGFTDGQVLVEGVEGGQIRLNWVSYKKGTDTQIGKTSEYVSLPALNTSIVSLVK